MLDLVVFKSSGMTSQPVGVSLAVVLCNSDGSESGWVFGLECSAGLLVSDLL